MAEPRGRGALLFFLGKASLIVDDERKVAAMLAEMLAVHGYWVETAGNRGQCPWGAPAAG